MNLREALRARDNKLFMSLLNTTDVNAECSDGSTAIHHVYTIRQARALVLRGANVQKKDACGRCVLHNVNKFPHLVNYFIKRKVNVNEKDKYGHTPLYFAQRRSVCQLLLNAGCNVNSRDNSWMTVMHGAGGLQKFWDLFIQYGANVNAIDRHGNTPLHYALSAKETKLLLDAGAIVNVYNKFGFTAFTVKASREQRLVLMMHGCDITRNDVANARRGLFLQFLLLLT